MKMLREIGSVLIIFICIFAHFKCSVQKGATMGIKKEAFGKMQDGTKVYLYTLTNKNGSVVKITNYGGIVISIMVPNRDDELGDVVLGYDQLEDYLEESPYFGAIVGRYANRIAGGKFILDGVEYKLAQNDGQNHLHGGKRGFDKVVWDAREIVREDCVGLQMDYTSRDGEEGYPGTLSVTVTYLWTHKDELKIKYSAVTDRKTVVNLTNHSYFNLAGAGTGDILRHELTIYGHQFTPVDGELIPYGELLSVLETPMDFTMPSTIGARIDKEYEQLHFGPGGYDHNWVLDGSDNLLSLAAEVYEPGSGRVLEVRTTQPGIQFYSGNFLDGTIKGKDDKSYLKHYGFCLETQHFPNSPNESQFPSVVLNPGETYKQTTIFKFYRKNREGIPLP